MTNQSDVHSVSMVNSLVETKKKHSPEKYRRWASTERRATSYDGLTVPKTTNSETTVRKERLKKQRSKRTGEALNID